ncbi:MAG TPA: hypothetical protein HA282_04350 [Nanoarchaeota archaeon]|nr:hypothetical protein [Nanoarchaeota archaeon]HIH66416.1 hypothetical protein [Nanoarchaeota archaeon]
MANETQQILKELEEIRIELRSIKENMPDKEMFLTAGEKRLLKESYENEKSGRLISSKDLRKAVGI